ncbi:MAG: hypothetical protein LBC69_02460 [Eubacteriaceae bacterium]|jgi:hypothetical protein|nr:hypothetical protein [Eubacteriaceae bacterium]
MRKRIAWGVLASCAICLAGCQAYTAHDKTYKSLIGTWVLDSVYIDSKPVKFEKQTIAFTKEEKGTIIDTVIVKESVYDDDGNLITPEETDQTTKNFSVSTSESDDGRLTITTSDGEVTNYEFAVDVPAQVLHLFMDTEEGGVRHLLYLEASALSPPSQE